MLTLNQIDSDNRKMKRFIGERIPPDGTRIVLVDGTDGPAWVDLIPLWDEEGECDLVLNTNEPDAFGLRDVYDHLRRKELTGREWERELVAQVNRLKIGKLEREREKAVLNEELETSPTSERFLSAHDIVDYYQGKISLRLAYQIMDECEPVRAGKKRLITNQSFEEYLRAGNAQAPKNEESKLCEPGTITISPKHRNSRTDVEFEFFRFQH